jgi:hypothetical protein
MLQFPSLKYLQRINIAKERGCEREKTGERERGFERKGVLEKGVEKEGTQERGVEIEGTKMKKLFREIARRKYRKRAF